MSAIACRSIGVVRSPVTEGRDDGWASVVSELHLDDDVAAGLEGLGGFSHAIVVFWMHRSSFDAKADLVRRPRGRQDMPEVGIFAQRAKHRPNPIGLTAVRVLGRRANVVQVQGLDAIDGTPLLDLKPYVPAFDAAQGATAPGWMERLMEGYF
jgi:tRNA-Thr(GGU) m(6)t(6)A37 methyltransferase TsaA